MALRQAQCDNVVLIVFEFRQATSVLRQVQYRLSSV